MNGSLDYKSRVYGHVGGPSGEEILDELKEMLSSDVDKRRLERLRWLLESLIHNTPYYFVSKLNMEELKIIKDGIELWEKKKKPYESIMFLESFKKSVISQMEKLGKDGNDKGGERNNKLKERHSQSSRLLLVQEEGKPPKKNPKEDKKEEKVEKSNSRVMVMQAGEEPPRGGPRKDEKKEEEKKQRQSKLLLAQEEEPPERGGSGENEGADSKNGERKDDASSDVDVRVIRYAELLIAKEKLIRSKIDKQRLKEEEEIVKEFADYVKEKARNGGKSEKEALIEALKEVNRQMDVVRPEENALLRLGRMLRKLPMNIGLAIMGIGGFLLIPIAPGVAIPLIGAAIIGRSISIYAAVNSIMSFIHEQIRQRVGKLSKRLGASVFYGNEKMIEENVKKNEDEGIVEKVAREVAAYGKKFRRYKIIRHIVSAVAAIGYGVYKALNLPISEAKSVAVSSVDVSAHKGEGIWHISKRVLHAYYGDAFDKLPKSQQNLIIDALKDKIVENPAKFGLSSDELIQRAINKGGPWLKVGATIDKLADKVFVEESIGKYKELLKHAAKVAGKAMLKNKAL